MTKINNFQRKRRQSLTSKDFHAPGEACSFKTLNFALPIRILIHCPNWSRVSSGFKPTTCRCVQKTNNLRLPNHPKKGAEYSKRHASSALYDAALLTCFPIIFLIDLCWEYNTVMCFIFFIFFFLNTDSPRLCTATEYCFSDRQTW